MTRKKKAPLIFVPLNILSIPRPTEKCKFWFGDRVWVARLNEWGTIYGVNFQKNLATWTYLVVFDKGKKNDIFLPEDLTLPENELEAE